ncbi:MAG: hypothetical protein QOJ09_1818 [Actinomycetota bacterium]|jgi:hypothetical protein|nr:hypothetical protein [Actinomycetota bacterium]
MTEQERTEKAKEAVEHLQQAALQMIAAARAVLDIAEEMVKDPAPLLAAAAATAEAAARTGARFADPAAHVDDGPAPEPRVQHIRVS